MNLWYETEKVLNDNGKKWKDVIAVCTDYYLIDKENFKKLARDYECDDVNTVDMLVKLVGKDFIMFRQDLDGTGGNWEYREINPVLPKKFKTINTCYTEI